jgi:hypothetical protein
MTVSTGTEVSVWVPGCQPAIALMYYSSTISVSVFVVFCVSVCCFSTYSVSLSVVLQRTCLSRNLPSLACESSLSLLSDTWLQTEQQLLSSFLHSSIAWSEAYRISESSCNPSVHTFRNFHCLLVPISYQIHGNCTPQFLKVHDN